MSQGINARENRKIAIFHHSFDPMSGAERVTVTLIEALNNVNICPDVYTSVPISRDYLNLFYVKKYVINLYPLFHLKLTL
jgi:hypothetical protein